VISELLVSILYFLPWVGGGGGQDGTIFVLSIKKGTHQMASKSPMVLLGSRSHLSFESRDGRQSPGEEMQGLILIGTPTLGGIGGVNGGDTRNTGGQLRNPGG